MCVPLANTQGVYELVDVLIIFFGAQVYTIASLGSGWYYKTRQPRASSLACLCSLPVLERRVMSKCQVGPKV